MTHPAPCCMRKPCATECAGAVFDYDLGGWLLPCPQPAPFVAHDGQAYCAVHLLFCTGADGTWYAACAEEGGWPGAANDDA